MNRKGSTPMRMFLRLVFAVLLVSTVGVSAIPRQAVAQATSNVAIVPTMNGASFYDACFVLVGFSNEGCDENQDGEITFAAVPLGTFTVTQTRDLGPGRSVANFTITVTGVADSDGWERFTASVSTASSSQATAGIVIGVGMDCASVEDCGFGTYAVRVTVSNPNGILIGSCTVRGDVRDRSHVPSCTVQGVPVGGDVVVSEDVSTLPPGFAPLENPIVKSTTTLGSASHDVVFRNVRTATAPAGNTQLLDIALITRDPADGSLLQGACYVLVDFSNQGCDENGDGQVTFAQVPEGRYTVRQTLTPAGYPTINDYEIYVSGMPVDGGGLSPTVPQGFVVRQSTTQNAPSTRNVSIILVRSGTAEKFVGEICAEIVGASNLGCDDDLADGQIDFLDVPFGGPYEVRFSNIPAGYRVYFDPNFSGLRVPNPGEDLSNQFLYAFVGPTSGGTGDPIAGPASSDVALSLFRRLSGNEDAFCANGWTGRES